MILAAKEVEELERTGKLPGQTSDQRAMNEPWSSNNFQQQQQQQQQ